MSQEITIIDRGRGPQLSTNRITVQDLVPYLKRHCTYDEIRGIMPILTVEEMAVVQRYVQDHYDEVMEQDRRIRERTAERVRQQRLRFPEPEGTKEERLARMKRLLQARQQEAN